MATSLTTPGVTVTPSSDPLKSYRPALTEAKVGDLVRDLYGLRVTSCRELDSYDDRNFHVRVSADRTTDVSNDHLPELWPHGYVFKVLNSLDSQRPDMIEAKTTMSSVAASQGFPCPRPVASVNGQLYVLHPLTTEDSAQDNGAGAGDGGGHTELFLVRLMEFLPGNVLASVTLTPDLSWQVGQYAARLDNVLRKVDDRSFPELRVNWNIQNVPSIRHLLQFVDDVKIANVIAEVIDAFETRVLKSTEGLQTGLIHSDFNDNNILVEPVPDSDSPTNPSPPSNPSSSSPSTPALRVCGILDFGDATRTLLLIEVAIAMAYITLLCPPDLDPDVMSGHALAGYLSEITLTERELELVALTMCARWSHSLTNAYHRRVLEPDNTHCQEHASKMWPHLHRLWTRPAHLTLGLWREVARDRGVTF